MIHFRLGTFSKAPKGRSFPLPARSSAITWAPVNPEDPPTASDGATWRTTVAIKSKVPFVSSTVFSLLSVITEQHQDLHAAFRTDEAAAEGRAVKHLSCGPICPNDRTILVPPHTSWGHVEAQPPQQDGRCTCVRTQPPPVTAAPCARPDIPGQ